MAVSFEFHRVEEIEFVQINLPGAWAVFSTKKGGESNQHFSGLNLALHVVDNIQAVIKNRTIFSESLGFSFENVVCARQVHGTKVQQVGRGERGRGFRSYEDALPDTDAMITADPGVILAAFFADCVPVYISDPVKGVVALAHAGWKGTLNRIASKTVREMQRNNGTDPSDCFAFIGPSVGPCCYEVSEDLISTFEENGHLTGDSPAKQEGEPKLDLWELNKRDLISSGMLTENIKVSGICTVCNDTLFFSHRRDSGNTGRMAAFISVRD